MINKLMNYHLKTIINKLISTMIYGINKNWHSNSINKKRKRKRIKIIKIYHLNSTNNSKNKNQVQIVH